MGSTKLMNKKITLKKYIKRIIKSYKDDVIELKFFKYLFYFSYNKKNIFNSIGSGNVFLIDGKHGFIFVFLCKNINDLFMNCLSYYVSFLEVKKSNFYNENTYIKSYYLVESGKNKKINLNKDVSKFVRSMSAIYKNANEYQFVREEKQILYVCSEESEEEIQSNITSVLARENNALLYIKLTGSLSLNFVFNLIEKNKKVILLDQFVSLYSISSIADTIYLDDLNDICFFYLFNKPIKNISTHEKINYVDNNKKYICPFLLKEIAKNEYIINAYLYNYVLLFPDQMVENNPFHENIITEIKKVSSTFKKRHVVTTFLTAFLSFIDKKDSISEADLNELYLDMLQEVNVFIGMEAFFEIFQKNCKYDLLSFAMSSNLEFFKENYHSYTIKEKIKFFKIMVMTNKYLFGRKLSSKIDISFVRKTLMYDINKDDRLILVTINYFLKNREFNITQYIIANITSKNIVFWSKLLGVTLNAGYHPFDLEYKTNIKKNVLSILEAILINKIGRDKIESFLGLLIQSYSKKLDLEQGLLLLNLRELLKESNLNNDLLFLLKKITYKYLEDREKHERLSFFIYWDSLELSELNESQKIKNNKLYLDNDNYSYLLDFNLDYFIYTQRFTFASYYFSVLKNKNISSFFNNKSKVENIRFNSSIYKIYSSINRLLKHNDKTLFFDISEACMNTKAILCPMMTQLSKQNYIFSSLSYSDDSLSQYNFNIDLEKAKQNFIKRKEYDHINIFDINLQTKSINYLDVNYYHGFYERLCMVYRIASIDLENEIVLSSLKNYLFRASNLILLLEELKKLTYKYNLKLFLMCGNMHAAPFSVVKDFVRNNNHQNFQIVSIGNAYENYYTNYSSKFARSFGVMNQSSNKSMRAVFLAEKNRFEKWMQYNENNLKVLEFSKKIIQVDRSFKTNKNDKAIYKRIYNVRKNGKRVITLLGKILFDMGVFYDGGPAHKNMTEWVNHTIEIAKRNKDILLLIKPHPCELKPEIALNIREYLSDIITIELPDNVIFLEHNVLNNQDLTNLTDLVVMWNGTSCLEYTISGIPVIMSSYFGKYDYHLELEYPDSKAHYEEMIVKKSLKNISAEKRQRAMHLLYYLGSDEVAIPNHYSRRAITNDSVGIPIWYEKKINNLIENGDPHLDYAIKKCVSVEYG